MKQEPVEAAAGEITALVRAWTDGDEAALARLMDRVNGELRAIARRMFRSERREHTLEPTALVNELYLRLAKQNGLPVEGRAHFFALASRIMRQILVDHARRRRAARRAGIHVTLDPALEIAPAKEIDAVELDDALSRLEAEYPREARIVELRFFGGLSIEEAAAELGLGTGTVKRDFRFARCWLSKELGLGGEHTAA